MALVYLKNNGLRETPVDWGFRLCAAVLGAPCFARACWYLFSPAAGRHSPWAIVGLFAWSLLWLWPAVTGYVFPQWRAFRG